MGVFKFETRLTLLLAALLVVSTVDVFGQGGTNREVTKRGTTSADFLTIPIGARATAMGNAITASVNDVSSIYWNPGGLGLMSDGAFGFEYAQWLADIDFNFFAIAFPFNFGTVGFGVTNMRTPLMEVTTELEQDGTGETFRASSMALSLSYGKQLTDRFSIGGTGKYVSEKIWNSSSGGVAFDVGTYFVTPLRGVRLGAAITNFGTKLQIGGDDLLVVVDVDPNNGGNNESNRAFLKTDPFDMPLTMRIGLAADLVKNSQSRVTVAVDALNPNNSEQFVNVGAEISLLGDLFQVRGGYSELFLEDNVRSLSVGAGLRYRFAPVQLSIDYAYEVQEYFSDVNRFSLSVSF